MNKDIMKQVGFKKEVKAFEGGTCPFCGKKIKEDEFRDGLSKKEYKISGLCQNCQDEMFNE